jgi:hypothetical protein
MLQQAQEASQPSPDVLLWLQRLTCTISLHTLFGKPQHPLSFEGDSENLKDEHKTQLLQEATKRFVNMSYPKWQLILNAFMVFTMKEKILLENVGNRDFWNPVD